MWQRCSGFSTEAGRPAKLAPMRAVLCTLLFAATAQAGRVIPLPPRLQPTESDVLRDRFHEAVERGLGGEVELVKASEVRNRLSSAPDLFQCGSSACMVRVAAVLHADRIVASEILQEGKSYTIKLRVFDAEGHEIGTGVEERCDICTVREADHSVQRAAARALALVASHSPAALATPEETGPETPRETAVAQPPSAPPSPSATSSPSPSPSPTSSPSPSPSPSAATDKHFPYRPVAYAAFGLAAAGLVSTIAFGLFASREDQPTCSGLADPRTQCPSIYKGNVPATVASGILTALAAASGGILLYLDSRRAAPRFSLVATPEGVAAMADVSF